MRYIILFFSILLSYATATSATNNENNLGPAIGTKIPHALTAQDQEDKARTFENLTGKNGLVVAFVRSADWCPYCKKQLIDLQKGAYAQLLEKEYNLIGISYDSVEKIANFAHRKDIKYTLLSDQDSEIIKAFGILNEKYAPGDSGYGIPHPIVVITDNTGTITAKLYEEGYKKRPQVEAILSAVN